MGRPGKNCFAHWVYSPRRTKEGAVEHFPYELRLPLAPYRFVWRDEPAVAAEKNATPAFTEERYTHGDGTVVVVRAYNADGSFHILSNRGEIEVIDNAQNPATPDPVSVVRLP
jgi:hypothetical protein